MDETIHVNTADDTGKIPVQSQAPEPAQLGGEDLILEDPDRSANSTDPDVANLVGQIGRLGFNMMALPLNLLPGQARYHAKNSLREGFMAFKSLVDEVATGIDESVARTRQAANPTKVKIADNSNIPPTNSGDDDVVGKGAV